MDIIGLLFVSVFCAGGLYAYGKEAVRLRRLIAAGKTARATVLKKDKIDTGSESVVHYLVTYEFSNDAGKRVVDEQDLNNARYFDRLAVGDTIDVLYRQEGAATSYPLGQVEVDRKIAVRISAGIALFWVLMVVVLAWRVLAP